MADIKYENEIENPNTNRENCFNNENFGIICAFFEKFESQMNVDLPNFVKLQEWLENTEELHQGLKELHIKLLRKLRKIVHETAWETALSKFCYSYSAQDAWEIERFGYKKSSLQVKLRVLKELLENQFERNGKLRNVMQNYTSTELRGIPIGHDKLGHAYWSTQDKDCNIRIYQEHLDEEIWQVVATNRNELIKLIQRLRGNEVVLPSQLSTIDEDTSSSNNSVPIVKPPPPEERDESQDAPDQLIKSNKNIEEIKIEEKKMEEKIPNLKIRLNDKNEGKIESTLDERKVKPLIISQSKLSTSTDEKPEKQTIMPLKKRALEEMSKLEENYEDDENIIQTVKRPRPTLLDAKREKINRYEKFKDESDQEDLDEELEEEEGEEEENCEDEDESEECEEEEDEEEELDEKEEEKVENQKAELVKVIKKNEDVGEAIEEKVMFVQGEGNGKDCEGSYIFNIAENDIIIGEVIEEEMMFVFGEGNGEDCLVGNDEIKSETEKTNNPPVFYFGQPGCLKLSPLKLKKTDSEESTSIIDSSLKNSPETILENDCNEINNGNEDLENSDISNVAGASSTGTFKNFEINEKAMNESNEQKIKVNNIAEAADVNKSLITVDETPIDYTSKTKKQLACSNRKLLEAKKHIDNPLISEYNVENVKCIEKVNMFEQNNIAKDDKKKDEMVNNNQNDKIAIEKDETLTKYKVNEKEIKDAIVKEQVTCFNKDILKLETDNKDKSSKDLSNIVINKVEVNVNCKEKIELKPDECNKEHPSFKDSKTEILKDDTSKTPVPAENIFLGERNISGPSSNRKRRLSAEKTSIMHRQISESETDLNSENVEEFNDGESESDDVGGKRARMRCKIVNINIRKKIEATKELFRSNSSSSSDEDKPSKKLTITKKINCISSKNTEVESKEISDLKALEEKAVVKNLSKDNKFSYTTPKKLAAKIEFLKQSQEAASVATKVDESQTDLTSNINLRSQTKPAEVSSGIIPKKRISPKKIEDKIAELKQNITKDSSTPHISKSHDTQVQENRTRSTPPNQSLEKDTVLENVDVLSIDNNSKGEDEEKLLRKRTNSAEFDNTKILNLTTKPKHYEETTRGNLCKPIEFDKGPPKKRLIQENFLKDIVNESVKNEPSNINDCNLPIKKKVSSKLLNAIKNIEERKLKIDQQNLNKSSDVITENKVCDDISLKRNETGLTNLEDRSRKRTISEKICESTETASDFKKEKINLASTVVENCSIQQGPDEEEEKGKIRIVVKTCSDALPVNLEKDVIDPQKVDIDNSDGTKNKELSLPSIQQSTKIRTTRRGAPPPGSLAESSLEIPIQTKRKGRHSGAATLQKTNVPKKAKKDESTEQPCNEVEESFSEKAVNENSDELPKQSESEQSILTQEKKKKSEESTLNSLEQGNISISPIKENSDLKQDTPKQQRRKREIDISNIIETENDVPPMRQSRRIALLKIREEAERRKMEEIALKKMKEDLKKRKKEEKKQLDVDPTVSEPSSSDESNSEDDSKKKRLYGIKKKNNKKGWSSGTEEDDHEQDAEEDLLFRYPPSDHGSPLFHSDHEFSCESDLEDESQAVPMKRARTARKEGEEIDAAQRDIDESCQKCGKGDHPEWILLCDKCDKGYHCSCLSPVLFIIPEGDWFCPPCQQEQLIVALETHLKQFDDLVEQKKIEEEERIRNEEIEAKEREREQELEALEAAEHALEIRLKKSHGTKSRRRKASEQESNDYNEDSDSEDLNNMRENLEKKKRIISRNERNGNERRKKFSSSSSKSSSSSSAATDSDDEPIYKLRKRRQVNVSYRYNDYDDLINRAIKEEVDTDGGAGNLGRGKDITTIIEADKEEKARLKSQNETSDTDEKEDEKENDEESLKKCNDITNPSTNDNKNHNDEPIKEESTEEKVKQTEENDDDDYESDKPLKSKSKSMSRRKKKSRKLNSLDVDSEDDASDEDFQTSSESEESESFSVSSGSDSSLEEFRKKTKKGKKVRKSARDRRKLRDFVVEESDDDSDGNIRRKSKKKRPKYSDYSESDLDDEDSSLSEDLGSSELCDDSTDSKTDDGAWRPGKRKKQKQSSKKTSNSGKSPATTKPKVYVKPKKKQSNDDDEKPFKASGIKKKAKEVYEDNESSDSGTERKKTRGRRLFYIDDFDDEESSDGGIKPGVKRPDTPPEEREKFIKRQEEIKRQLAEKKAAEANAAIENSSKNPPQKPDSLSTVPLSVIRAAKALDVDYLQRRGEDILSDEEEDDINEEDAAAAFGDALPDGLPDVMDEEAIAKMMEEEDFAQNQLKFPTGELIKSNKRTLNMVQKSGQPNVDRLPGVISQTKTLGNVTHPGQNLTLLQSALTQPPRPFQPSRSQLEAHLQLSASAGAILTETTKPRGRRKKITPLRDPQEKAAAVAAAHTTPKGSTRERQKTVILPPASIPLATQHLPSNANLNVAQPPQLYKPPNNNTQPSVITRMPQLPPRSRFPDQVSRFFSASTEQLRSPLRHGMLNPHHILRTPFPPNGPPPLRSGPPTINSPVNLIRQALSSKQSQFVPEPFRSRHPSSHLSSYRPPMYGNPGYPPPPQHPGSYPPGPYGSFYSPPPPPLAAHSSQRLTHTGIPSSVIVAAPPSSSHPPPTPSSSASSVVIHHSSSTILRKATSAVQPSSTIKSSTALETFDSKRTSPTNIQEDELNPITDNPNQISNQASSSEFSGLVSYFSSQHDDFNS